MGLLDFLQGDRSYSVAEGVEATTPFIPFPDLNKLPVKHQRRVIEAIVKANERIALYNKADRLANLGAFLALFGGQTGIYSTLDSFQKTSWRAYIEDPTTGQLLWEFKGSKEDAHTELLAALKKYIKPGYMPKYGAIEIKEPDWAKILGTSGVLTGLTYMTRNNAAGVGIPLTAIVALVGLDILGSIF